jgi:hypothetical protein
MHNKRCQTFAENLPPSRGLQKGNTVDRRGATTYFKIRERMQLLQKGKQLYHVQSFINHKKTGYKKQANILLVCISVK